MPKMSFAEFRATGRDVPGVGTVSWVKLFMGDRGRVYLDSLCIVDTKGKPVDSTLCKRWWTIIEYSEATSDNLEDVERLLYDWALINILD